MLIKDNLKILCDLIESCKFWQDSSIKNWLDVRFYLIQLNKELEQLKFFNTYVEYKDITGRLYNNSQFVWLTEMCHDFRKYSCMSKPFDDLDKESNRKEYLLNYIYNVRCFINDNIPYFKSCDHFKTVRKYKDKYWYGVEIHKIENKDKVIERISKFIYCKSEYLSKWAKDMVDRINNGTDRIYEFV